MKCKEYKKRDLFPNNKRAKDGKYCYCKSCHTARVTAYSKANPEKVNALKRVYHKANHRRIKYKLSPDDINKKLEEQGNKCQICKQDISNAFCVDHDHACCLGRKSCGKCVRGLLCQRCNRGLGNFHDSAETLQASINYLDKWNQIQYTNKSNSESEDICNSQN
jgi:Recombination endonuclease VII